MVKSSYINAASTEEHCPVCGAHLAGYLRLTRDNRKTIQEASCDTVEPGNAFQSAVAAIKPDYRDSGTDVMWFSCGHSQHRSWRVDFDHPFPDGPLAVWKNGRPGPWTDGVPCSNAHTVALQLRRNEDSP